MAFEIIKSIPAPDDYIWGITWDGTYLWCLDQVSKKIYKMDIDGNVISSFSVPSAGSDENPVRLVWDGTYFWCSYYCWKNTEHTIQRFDTNGNVIQSFKHSGGQVYALAWDGANLWWADYNSGKVFGNGSFDGPARPKGLAWDGTHLWCFAYPSTMYQMDTSGNIINSFAFPFPVDFSGSLDGLTWDGKCFWASAYYMDTIYQFGEVLSVTTNPATNITATTMQLNGSLNGLGNYDNTDCYFQYTNDPGFEQNIQETTLQNLAATGEFSDEITGLEAGKTYYFRAVARVVE